MKSPITQTVPVQTTWQTDKVKNVVCGSSSGGKCWLNIEVVNKLKNSEECVLEVVGHHTPSYDQSLIFDYIPSEVAQFCKDYSLDQIVIKEFEKLDEILLEKLRQNINSYGLESCLEIRAVRINRPDLGSMAEKFEAVEKERKNRELAEQQKKTEKVKLEMELQRELALKEREKQTSALESEIQLARARADSEKQRIIDETKLFSKTKEAEGVSKLYSVPGYLKTQLAKSAYHSAKLIIGEIPEGSIFYMGDSPSGSFPVNRTSH